jgi:uncharacterized membrane protein
MPEPTKIRFAEWRQYEIRTIKWAWSEIRASIFVTGGISAMITGVLGFWGTYWAGYVGKNETVGRCLIVACAAILGSILTCGGSFLFRLLRAPAKMEKEAKEKSERVEKIFEEVDKKNEAAHKKHVEILEHQIQTLQSQLDDRAKRKANKDILGDYLDQLQNRIFAIEKLGLWDYEKILKEGNDQESDELVGKIRRFISENIGLGEASCFVNLSGIKLARFDESLGSSDLMEKKKKWLHKINHLDHYSNQLREVIKQQ